MVIGLLEAESERLKPLEERQPRQTPRFGRRGRPAYDEGNPAIKTKHTFNLTEEDWKKWNGIVNRFAAHAGWDADRSDSRTFRSIIDLLDLDYSWMQNFEFPNPEEPASNKKDGKN